MFLCNEADKQNINVCEINLEINLLEQQIKDTKLLLASKKKDLESAKEIHHDWVVEVSTEIKEERSAIGTSNYDTIYGVVEFKYEKTKKTCVHCNKVVVDTNTTRLGETLSSIYSRHID